MDGFERLMSRDADVIVVGAGPAGSAVAALLSRGGVRVLLVDKSAAPPPKVCGEYLSPGCLPILDRLGALRPLRAAGARPLHGMLIHTAGGRMLRAPYPDRPRFQNAPPHALSAPRTLLDPLLLDLAVKAGVVFQPRVQVCNLLWHDGCVTGVEGRQEGRRVTYRARQVVGADGRHSVVARRMGAVRPHPWLDRMAIVTYLDGVDRADALGEIFLGRDRYAILNPIAATLTNVGLVVRRRDLTQGEDPRRAVRRIAASLPGLADRLSTANVVAPVRCLGPLAYHASLLAAPGGLLVGDAAGFLDPFTGEGIYAALRSAEIAARHVLEQGTPGGYEGAWRREFVPKWRIAALLQRAIRRERLADGLAAFLATRPALTALLMAAFGDLLSPDALRPARLFARLLAQLA